MKEILTEVKKATSKEVVISETTAMADRKKKVYRFIRTDNLDNYNAINEGYNTANIL